MSVEISEYATRLLSASGIEKVISIDDDNSTDSSPEELLAVLNAVDQSVLTDVIGPLLSIESGDRELIRDRVRNNWMELSKDVKGELLEKLTPPSEQIAESIVLATDIRSTSKLPEIFGDKLQALTLAKWEQTRDQLINDQMPPTLLLVDLSFTGEQRGKEEGLNVIANLLKMNPGSRIYCGLLTGLYQTSSVHADWKKIAADHGLDRERFVLIPKDSLDADKRTFLALIKLVIMNGPANSLKRAVSKAFEECLKESDIELSKLDVFEFERIICLTSSKEGVWEPDTLLRIFSLFHKKFVRRSLHNDADVYKSADQLRTLTGIPVGEWGGPTEMEIALRRLEWFEEAEDINEQYLPLELGDVFRIESRPNKLYVLVAQPCDLMMRQSGKRHHTVENALLLEATPIADESNEVKPDSERDHGFYFKLDFFETLRDWEINLRKIHYVNLEVLDLCVFRSDGSAALSDKDTAPGLMSEAWRARFPRLAEKMKKARNRYAELMKIAGMKAADASKLSLNTSIGNLWNVVVDLKSSSITFDVSRVGRIRQPRSGALLARYANAFARDAFEHDLTRRPDRAATPAAEPTASETEVKTIGHENDDASQSTHIDISPPTDR
jgi:hypothetical protein